MHVAAEVARAELYFCQHAADRAAAALRERQAAPLAALAAACGTWVDWANHSAAVCGPTVADGKRQVQRVSSTCPSISLPIESAVVRVPPPSLG